MNRLFATIITACLAISAYAQGTESKSNEYLIEYQTFKPTFQKGDTNEFSKWVYERLVYDPEAKSEGVQGRVTLQFTVEADGTVGKVKVLRGIDPRLDAEAVRVVSSSPRWEQHGENPKPVTYTFPVIFTNDRPNPYPCEKFQYGEKKSDVAEIYCISHGSVVIRIRDLCILIDPVRQLGKEAHEYGWFRPYGNKTVLLTHEHPDHFSRETIEYLSETSKPEAFTVYGNRKSIEELGKGTVLNNGDTVSVKYAFKKQDMKIRAVPAYNTTKDHRKFHPKGNGNGYLIEAGELVIYVAGDTEPIPEMKRLGKVDVAFLPVNQPYTMTPEQCIKAARDIKPKVLIPYHMGDTDISSVIKAFERSDTKVIVHERLR